MGASRRGRVVAAAGLILAAVGLALAGCGKRGGGEVDGAAIAAADQRPGEWLSHGRDYNEQRFSPLTKISDQNVGQLGLAWYADLGTNRGQETTPLMVDGVLYVSTSWSKVKAYDARTGKLLWAYDPQVPGEYAIKACCDVVNRGVAFWKGRVYVGVIDGRLVALDAKSGREDWTVRTTDEKGNYAITGAPRVVKGKVIIGNGGADLGARGYVSAYDAESGKLAWRFFTVPGAPGQTDGAASDRPLAEKAASTWTGEWWKYGGGGTVWDAIVYDSELDQLYIGVGNGSPWNQAIRSPGGGDNLFLSSIVALKPDSGEYLWHYQTTPGDNWDYTATQHIMLADLNIGGQARKVLMQVPKNGFFYVIDRKDGKLLSARPIMPINWASGVDMATGRPIENPDSRYARTGKPWNAMPGPLGAHNWQPMAFNPKTGLVYIPANISGWAYINDPKWKPAPMGFNIGVDLAANSMPQDPAVKKSILDTISGALIAWDPVNQKEVWRADYPTPGNGGVLSTAGNLVFQGSVNAEFVAYAANDGRKLWSMPTQSPPMGSAMTYEVDGEQYVAVVTGWGGAWGLSPGEPTLKAGQVRDIGRLLVFKLGGRTALPPVPAAPARALNPPPMTATPAQVKEGFELYSRFCGLCHGDAAVGGGATPDLRYSALLNDQAAFKAVVIDGALKERGMVSFAPVMSPQQADSIRWYLAQRAHDAQRGLTASGRPGAGGVR